MQVSLISAGVAAVPFIPTSLLQMSLLQDNMANVDALKTCCGILAILSREESNKLQIARDGIRLIVSTMEIHIGQHKTWFLLFHPPTRSSSSSFFKFF